MTWTGGLLLMAALAASVPASAQVPPSAVDANPAADAAAAAAAEVAAADAAKAAAPAKAADARALAAKAAEDSAAAEKAATDRFLASQAAADKAMADKAVEDKAVADHAAADQAAADKARVAKAAAAGTFADGQNAFDSGDYAHAQAIWTALAGQGDDNAAVALGGMLDQGIGITRDPTTALGWYGVAAAHGLPAAEFDVAVMLDSGRGAPRDLAEAATWYARAAAHGNRRAQYNLGQLYGAGEGVPLNPAVSRTWYDAAARSGLPAAKDKLMALLPTSKSESGAANLHAAEPKAPLPNQVLTVRPAASGVEFVWLAPPQPVPVVFFVEVASVGGQGTHRTAARYVSETAIVLDLGKAPGEYAWRVYAVDQRQQRYVATEWQRFSMTATESSHD